MQRLNQQIHFYLDETYLTRLENYLSDAKPVVVVVAVAVVVVVVRKIIYFHSRLLSVSPPFAASASKYVV